jgi:hypothetical protein
MASWKLPWRTLREAPANPQPEEETAPELQSRVPDADNVAVAEADAFCREVRANVEIGDESRSDVALSVPISLSDRNAGGILELTQRLREQRERERTATPPVYNFGAGEQAWSGGDW